MKDKRITIVVEADKSQKIIQIQTILMKKNQTAISYGKVLNMCLENGVDKTLKEAKAKK